MAKEMKASIIKFRLEICVERDEDVYYAYCPALKGVHVDGDTEEEAIKNAKDAAGAYIRSLIKHGEVIPLNFEETEGERKLSRAACPASQRHTQDVRIAV